MDSFCYVTENVTFKAKKGEKLASVEEIYKAMLDVAAQHAAETAMPWEREPGDPIVLHFSVHKIK